MCILKLWSFEKLGLKVQTSFSLFPLSKFRSPLTSCAIEFVALAMWECAVRRGQVGCLEMEGRGILMEEETMRTSPFRSIVFSVFHFIEQFESRVSECSSCLATAKASSNIEHWNLRRCKSLFFEAFWLKKDGPKVVWTGWKLLEYFFSFSLLQSFL